MQEGNYTAAEKKKTPLQEAIAGGYWTIVTAGYLAWSFLTDAWQISWVIWPVAGILFVAVRVFMDALQKRGGER